MHIETTNMVTHPVCIHATAFLLLLLVVVSSWNNGVVHGFARLAVTTTSLTLDPWIPGFTNGLTIQRAMTDESSAKHNDNDDGWGDGDDDDDDDASLSNKSQLQELQALQQKPQRSTLTNNNVTTEPPERDLFIPIFALVSLAGLFGAYGYEVLRLYSRGELYLPWNN